MNGFQTKKAVKPPYFTGEDAKIAGKCGLMTDLYLVRTVPFCYKRTKDTSATENLQRLPMASGQRHGFVFEQEVCMQQTNGKRALKAHKPQKNSWRKEIQHYGVVYLMFLVPLAILILFKYIPMYGAQIAFRNYKPTLGVLASPWVGWKYFTKFFESQYFFITIKNTLVLNFYSLLTFPLCLVFALMLKYAKLPRMAKSVQMISYAPHFISTVVVCGLLTQFLNPRIGVINKLIQAMGGRAVNWMGRETAFKHIYVWSDVWQHLGFNSIIFISALAGISPDLHEAAIVDGASLKQRIIHVDIPGVLPTFIVLLILRFGSLMSIGYEKVLLLQNDLNRAASEIISTYTYKIALQSMIPQYSYASAIGLFTSVVNLIMLVSVNGLTKKLSGSSLW